MFDYFDLSGTGKDLKEFQRLRTVVNEDAYWLKNQLFHNRFRIMQQPLGISMVIVSKHKEAEPLDEYEQSFIMAD